MKKRSLVLTVILMGITASVWAGKSDQAIIKEASKNQFTVAQATKATDATGVTLTGEIAAQLKDEHYQFKDNTGTITVEIDRDLATPQQLQNGVKVKIIGEVDTHRDKPTDIEAVQVEIL
ncbi:NirD/YgiW/YdeI family stress tolerance protein [Acinetobacter shaoyimingii]|uniref:NirD/YgiW/YdeI family stress tolerance protein n=1 Tax=Acinetobacter shaoyimingii TaxID=2715164 RepID=A0A6G8RRF8_9GAMM|nr:NirD/YgiW/YdeI family stress tolerance protein [Acinetobacter shaoyimingii]NHB59445.1 NirD/YgiW/YdeI family stress tolerance protein [Acinetobacter shaoyimingii]QIO04457.1 NirD/YgiW/YdeI family stress tolerance protein [Acinetobacter shaoyimingii]